MMADFRDERQSEKPVAAPANHLVVLLETIIAG